MKKDAYETGLLANLKQDRIVMFKQFLSDSKSRKLDYNRQQEIQNKQTSLINRPIAVTVSS